MYPSYGAHSQAVHPSNVHNHISQPTVVHSTIASSTIAQSSIAARSIAHSSVVFPPNIMASSFNASTVPVFSSGIISVSNALTPMQSLSGNPSFQEVRSSSYENDSAVFFRWPQCWNLEHHQILPHLTQMNFGRSWKLRPLQKQKKRKNVAEQNWRQKERPSEKGESWLFRTFWSFYGISGKNSKRKMICTTKRCLTLL